MPKPKKLSAKKKQNIIIGVTWGVIIIAAAGYGLYRNSQYGSKSIAVNQADISQVTDDGVTWLPEPQAITITEQLFTPDWEQANLNYSEEKVDAKYYKVGDDNGKDIIIAILPAIDPSGDRKIMMVKEGEEVYVAAQIFKCSRKDCLQWDGAIFWPSAN